MNTLKRLSKVYQESEQITFDDSSRIVLISDCHRGDGSNADVFLNNQNLYFFALTHYFKENFIYIELGDGDELWKNRKLKDIIQVHKDVFWLLSEFYRKGRLYFIYGNHDMVKKKDKFVKKNLYQYYDSRKKKYIPLFPNVKIHQGIILKHRDANCKIFLVHGHQADYFNDEMWKLSRFLLRYIWGPLELFGVKDQTSAAKNYEKKDDIEKKLSHWTLKEKHILIAGHTHRPMFPEPGKPPYFNDGSCVHPRCITAIEIVNGHIILVKWAAKTRDDGTLYVAREVISGPRKLKDYFS